MLKALASMLFAVALASGADVSGIWTGTLADRNGDLQDLSFRFTQGSGSLAGNLAGKMYGDNESVSITDGKVESDRITFVVTTELNGSISKMVYTGSVSGSEIHMTRAKADAPAPSAADKPEKAGDAAAPKPPTKQTFVLKRL